MDYRAAINTGLWPMIYTHKEFIERICTNGKFIPAPINFGNEKNKLPSADVIRLLDNKVFEVKSFKKELKDGFFSMDSFYKSIGQVMSYKCIYGDAGLIFPIGLELVVGGINEKCGNILQKYSIEVLYL